MSEKKEPVNFLELTQSGMEVLGFWTEGHKSTVMLQIERSYARDVVRVWSIGDIVIHGDKVLLKWYKRLFPLTEEEIDAMHGTE